ncbi:hypothetical protein NFI96_020325 [Prochilodus magdalenae]|nr:hypothetical protein NFI96_020325 [Prochilodus magdalenae]
MELNYKLVWALLLLPGCFLEAKRIRGVSMSYRRLYKERKSFLCMDGSRLIPFRQVNDDYCDCPDGSDEPGGLIMSLPGTAACPSGRFYCVNVGFRPHYIPSSRVNDGICDCCDGSDEFASRMQCSNKCRMLGQKERRELEDRMKTVNEGLFLKKQLIEEGALIWQEKQPMLGSGNGDLKLMCSECPILLAQLRQLQKVSEDLTIKVEDYKKRKLKAEAEKERLEKAIKPDLNGVGDESHWPGAVPHGSRPKMNEGKSSVIHDKEQKEKTAIQQGQNDPVKTPPHEAPDKLPPVIRAAQSGEEFPFGGMKNVTSAVHSGPTGAIFSLNGNFTGEGKPNLNIVYINGTGLLFQAVLPFLLVHSSLKFAQTAVVDSAVAELQKVEEAYDTVQTEISGPSGLQGKTEGENQSEKAQVQTVESEHEQKGLGERVVEERRESETRTRQHETGPLRIAKLSLAKLRKVELKEKLDIDYGPEQEFVFLLGRCVQMTVSE